MSGIFAVNGSFDEEICRQRLKRMEHRGRGRVETFREDSMWLGQLGGEHKSGLSSTLALDGKPMWDQAFVSKEDMAALIDRYGLATFKGLKGSFAVVGICQGSFFAARDRWGSKPLYYAYNGGTTVFASEMKALQGVNREIQVFPPGYTLWGEGDWHRHSGLPQTDPARVIGDLKLVKNELKQALCQAVAKVLAVPEEPGIFLSGGLDSAVITCAAQLCQPGIKTFAAGLEGCNDLEKAREVAGFLGTEHHEYIYTIDEMHRILPRVIFHLESFDVELVNSSIANFLVAALAREKGIEIALSGEGADELFGGYHYLKEKEGEAIQRAINDLLRGMHNSGLQRVDRMTAAHGIHCCMPFLSPAVVEVAMKTPLKWKIKGNVEKYILRKAFWEDLPESVIGRKKEQFGIGSGNERAMAGYIANSVSEAGFKSACKTSPIKFKNKEEYYYYRIFKDYYPEPQLLKTVNRWLH